MITDTTDPNAAIDILVVEDSAIQAEMLRRTLVQRGYAVRLAKNGAEALDIMRHRLPTLVLSDIAMPVMDGYEMCRRIKHDEALQDIPVILLTTLSDPEDIIRGLNAKADNYLTKPYDEHALLARIDHLLASQELRKTTRMHIGIEIDFAGKRHVIDADRRQILDLLLSTFENAVHQSRELLKRTQELEASEDSYRALLENTFSGFYRATLEGKFLAVNPAYVKMLDYDSKERLLRVDIPSTLYFSSTEYEAFRARLLAAGGLHNDIEQLRRQDGGTIIVEQNIRVVRDADGAVLYVEGFVNDITERKRVEIALQEAKEAAEAANHAKSEFLANMSHDIRTPMNGVIGMVEPVLDTELTPEQREYLKLAKSSADALLCLLNDILDLSKIEARKLDLDLLDFRLRDSLEMTLQPLALRAHTKGLELSCRVAPDVPDALVGDLARLRQIIVNLVGNAIKFTAQGEVVVEVRRAAAHGDERGAAPKAADNQAVCLHFSVRDTGIGIPVEKQQVIFEPFTQVDSSTTRQYGGTGLGLAISSQLAMLLGGRIWVESAVGQGSTFHFTTRFGLQAMPRHDPKSSEQTLSPLPNLEGEYQRPLHILLAEDNAVNQRLVVRLLEKRGHTVIVATTGREALAALEKGSFDLILMDVQMPEMDGFEATAAIRAREHGAGRHIPIIAMTAHAMAGDQRRCLDAGMDDYISKPIQAQVVFDAIEKARTAAR